MARVFVARHHCHWARTEARLVRNGWKQKVRQEVGQAR